jgi:thioredoxin-dependent peroxiredoxin
LHAIALAPMIAPTMKPAIVTALFSLVAACATSAPPPASPPSAAPAPTAASASPSPAGTANAQASTPSPAAAPTAVLAASPSPAVGGAADDLIGKPAPDFTATAQDGSLVHLAALKGKTVVLYFYPKDETPGCTKEACSFRDAWDRIGKTGAVLIGVSADTLDSHKSFVAHYKLPFLLVSDPDGKVGDSYGVPFKGHHHRETFVIGADGSVRKAYRQVDVSVHAQQILGDLTP